MQERFVLINSRGVLRRFTQIRHFFNASTSACASFLYVCGFDMM